MSIKAFLNDRYWSVSKSIIPWIKRHSVLTPILTFIILIVIISAFGTSVVPNQVGIIKVEGVILESEQTVRKIHLLANMSNIKGIVVRVNSPGGAVAPSQEIYEALKQLRTKKPVYISISSVAASGGYYVALGGTKIFANAGSLTGSIGVIMQTYHLKPLLDKIGIGTVTIKSGKNKDIGSMFRKMQPEERKLLETVINDTHDQFVEAVTENRKMDEKDVRKLADGRVFTGRQALKSGLIDDVASFSKIINQLKHELGLSEDSTLFYPPVKRGNWLDQLGMIESLFQIKETFTTGGLYFINTHLLN